MEVKAVREPTDLERMIVLAEAGRATTLDVLELFAVSPVIVPSGTQVTDNLAQLQPVLFDVGGASMLAVFTHADQIVEFGDLAAFALNLTAADLADNLPAQVEPEGVDEEVIEGDLASLTTPTWGWCAWAPSKALWSPICLD